MKADNLKQTESLYSHGIALAGLCLALLLVTSHRADGNGWTASGTTYLNVYLADGSSTISPTVSPYNPPETIGTSGGIGTPLTSYGTSSWLQGFYAPTAAPYPGPVTASWGPYFFYDANVSAIVDYQQSSYFYGSNNVSSSGVTPVGTSLTFVNSGPNIGELRLDWSTQYTYNGPTLWQAGASYNYGDVVSDTGPGNLQYCIKAGTSGASAPAWNTVVGQTTTDNGASGVIWVCGATYVPNYFIINFSGAVNHYSAVAGQQSFQVGANPPGNEVLTWGGDIPNYASLPTGANGLSGYLDNYFSANGGVYGYDTPHLVFNSSPYGYSLPYQQCYNLNTVDIWGYIDVFVDPGTAVVGVQPSLPAELGITMQGGTPVVYIATITGPNMMLQMCTNLATTNWTTLSNLTTTAVSVGGSPFLGFEIPNPPTPAAYFRVKP